MRLLLLLVLSTATFVARAETVASIESPDRILRAWSVL